MALSGGAGPVRGALLLVPGFCGGTAYAGPGNNGILTGGLLHAPQMRAQSFCRSLGCSDCLGSFFCHAVAPFTKVFFATESAAQSWQIWAREKEREKLFFSVLSVAKFFGDEMLCFYPTTGTPRTHPASGEFPSPPLGGGLP